MSLQQAVELAVKPSELVSTLEHVAVKTHLPTFTWGEPGVGKSSIHAQVADKVWGKPVKLTRRQLNKAVTVTANGDRPYFIDLRLPLFDAVDLRGIPMERGGRTAWLTPGFLPTEGEGMLFLDELPQAMPIVQSAASQLILDRRIGDYKLPDGWVICGAGNYAKDRAATHTMPTHIRNRFVHLNLAIDYDDWAEWAVNNGINDMVRVFLGFRPEYLHKFDKNVNAFPTPRTWEYVSRLLVDFPDDPRLMLTVLSGTVGEAAAKELVGFIRVFRDMPDYEEIVKRPDDCKIPKEVSGAYATGTMLGARAEPKDMKAIVRYLRRMPEEFEVLAMRYMVKSKKELAETPTYIQWVADHQNVLTNKAA